MATKPYKPQISKEQQAKESTVPPYARTTPMRNLEFEEIKDAVSSDIYWLSDEERISVMKAKEQYAKGEYFTQEEMDEIVAEWLS